MGRSSALSGAVYFAGVSDRSQLHHLRHDALASGHRSIVSTDAFNAFDRRAARFYFHSVPRRQATTGHRGLDRWKLQRRERGRMEQDIGAMAGAIWRTLNSRGMLTWPQLKKEVGAKAPIF